VTLAPVVLAAVAVSVVASGILVAGVALLTRARALDATARHTLWFGTLLAIALLPIAGIVASVAQATRAPSPVGLSQPAAARGASVARRPSAAVSAGSSVSGPAHNPAGRLAAPPTGRLDATRLRNILGSITQGVAVLVLAALALGAVVGFAGLIVSLARLRAVKRRSSPLDESLANDLPWLTATRAGRETYLRLSYEIETPVAIGFNRPVILIPTDLATHSGLVAIEDLVVHEHAHLRRYDDYTNLIQRLIERVFWFNPFVWIVGRRIALEREFAADDTVVARNIDSTRYAEALWRLAREMRMPAHALVAPGALFTRKQISLRIEALLAPGRAHLRGLGPVTSGAAFAVALVSFAIVALAAPPLEWPAPLVPAQVAQTDSQIQQEAASLQTLSDLIGKRLASEQRALEKPGSVPSPQRIADLQTETMLLSAKLDVMKGIAQRIDSAKSQQRVNALQDEAKTLTSELGALARRHAAGVAQHVEGPALHVAVLGQQHVAVPEQDVAVPAQHVTVPAQHVTVPAQHVTVPAQHVTIPMQHVDVPKVSVTVPATRVDLQATRVTVPATVAQVPPVNVSVPIAHVDIGPKHVAMGGSEGSLPSDIAITRQLIAHCTGCDLSGRDLRNLDLHGLSLSGVDLSGADLRGANLSGTNFSGSDLSRARLDGADLTNAVFSGADIGGTSFRGARMDGVRFAGISLSHANFDASTLRSVLVHGCSGCDMSHMDLRGADFHGVSLAGADFSHSDLSGANLSGGHFSGVSFDHANLDRADLRNAKLTGCSLSGASLKGALLEGIRLTGTSLGRDP
jgi:uncharacterized protein YjbI with pentapeptide repeats/beta-lactamase regulating signal transducer with metallopeptidase domain